MKLFVAFVLGMVAAPLAAGAQPPTKVLRIGFLAGGSASSPVIHIEAFRQGLRELGYVEGQNIILEQRYSDGRTQQLHDSAAELVRLGVDIIVTEGTPAALAAKQATRTIPIVMATSGDPVGSGIVASLARPGGNITGLTFFFAEVSAKRLELLKEAVPRVTRVAILRNPANPAMPAALKEVEATGLALRLELQHVEARGPDDLDSAFSTMSKGRAEALVALEDPMLHSHMRRIAALAAKHRLPAAFSLREFAEAGGLIAYGADRADMYRRAASFVHRILSGAKPADLPVERTPRFELVVNLKTAEALGLTLPQSILLRADQAIP